MSDDGVAAARACLRPRPGPLYWDFRCQTCGGDIAYHPGLLRRLWLRLRPAASGPKEGR